VDRLLPALRIELPEDQPLEPTLLFSHRPREVWMEIGFGAGEHLAAQAAAHPEIGLIGCEPFVNGVAGLLTRVEAEGLRNVRIFDNDARLLLPHIQTASIARIFLLFSDPWPKKRHHRRRIVAPLAIEHFARLLTDGGEFRFASDHAEFVRWTLDLLTRHPDFCWRAETPGDWRERPGDGFATRYETKARAQGRSPIFLRFQRRPRG
jgi:tRNA (guanine-N7-)-methyltransferase